MSLIFQALRRLGSETEEIPFGGSAPRMPGTRPAVRAARPGSWWLLAIVLGLVTVPLALNSDLPSRAVSVLAESGAWLRGPDPVSSAAATVAQSDRDVAGETSTAAVGAPVVDATPIVAASATQKRRPEFIVAQVQRGPRLDTRTASVVSSTFVSHRPGNNKPASVSVNRTVNARSPQKEDRVVTQATFGESLTVVSSPAPGPSDPTNTVEKQSNKKLVVATREKSTVPRRAFKREARRELQRTRSREKSLQVSRLTADLARAVQADDETKIAQVLDELGSKAGADSNYVLNMRAYVALARGQYAEVEIPLRRVLARDATDANAGLNMAVAESRTGRLQQARQRLEQLASVYPDDERIVLMLQSLPQR